jgi:hypothetical protein
MLKAINRDIERVAAESPGAAPGEAPKAAPAPHMDQTTERNVSNYDENSHNMAFETRMSNPLRNQGPGRPDETARRPYAAPAPPETQRIAENVSENDINSHAVAFETQMSERPLKPAR